MHSLLFFASTSTNCYQSSQQRALFNFFCEKFIRGYEIAFKKLGRQSQEKLFDASLAIRGHFRRPITYDIAHNVITQAAPWLCKRNKRLFTILSTDWYRGFHA